jgi:methylated-DNA-[protein]-cysteine S-methyltransferase
MRMDTCGFTVFETVLGWAGIAWSASGVTGTQLPEPRESIARTRLRSRFRGMAECAPSVQVERALDAIAALLRGEPMDLGFITLDLDGVPEFDRRVYAVARTIPPGQTLSYGGVAKRMGEPLLTREVGQALARNPCPIVVPCHRVLARGGRLGGFSAPGGVATKLRLLAIEGADAAGARPLFAKDSFELA